ncbi:MAG: transporter [Gammaproteobacteria bacterium]|nr:transporter [Gammaproteobacteria bacterium]
MSRILIAALAGAFFGVGMMLSGMANPARVLNFFDVLGNWDPTLAWVMGGALVPMTIAWRIRARMQQSVLGETLPGPASTTIDTRLIAGGTLFGMGWGIVGICPGAVVPALGVGGWPILLFAVVMLTAIGVTRFWLNRQTRQTLAAAGS